MTGRANGGEREEGREKEIRVAASDDEAKWKKRMNEEEGKKLDTGGRGRSWLKREGTAWNQGGSLGWLAEDRQGAGPRKRDERKK